MGLGSAGAQKPGTLDSNSWVGGGLYDTCRRVWGGMVGLTEVGEGSHLHVVGAKGRGRPGTRLEVGGPHDGDPFQMGLVQEGSWCVLPRCRC